MNINEFQENNIVDPNLRRKSQGTQENSTIVDPNVSRQKRIVTPQEMGFTHETPKKIERAEQPILDDLDKAIERKQREARLLSDAIDESGEEGVTEEEFQDLLVQAKDELYEDDGIPTEEELDNILPKKSNITSLPMDNPTTDIMDELDAELEEDERDYMDMDNNQESSNDNNKVVNNTEEVQSAGGPIQFATKITRDESFNFESGDINFDKENEDLDENIDEVAQREKESKEQMDKLRVLVREKIRPVSEAFDISSFAVSNRPAANVIATPRDNGQNVADWVLMSSQKPIYMRRFSGTEIERLANGGSGRTRLNKALDTWQLIYNHIVDPEKPATLEEWAKATSFLDIDHIYMAIYRANFEGSNYIPYECTNRSCPDKTFLSDNFNIMDMCKFANKEAREKFDSIIGGEVDDSHKLYSTAIIPVSEDYAFAFREPSLYNVIFESAVLDEDFVTKFDNLVSICTYIDNIYYINKEKRELQPVRTNYYQNNMKKTVKSRIINFSKIISTLNSDQYNTLIAYMNKINENGELLTYQLPEVTCPKCGTIIPSSAQEAQSLVFTRHQLAALAAL